MERIQAALEKAKFQASLGDPLEAPDPVMLARLPVEKSEKAWESLPAFRPNPKHLAKHKIVAAAGKHSACSQFDILRTTVLQKLRQNNWTTIAITSPSAGCGKTSVALNLALTLSNQPNCRTVLLDLDLRRPRIAALLGMAPPSIEDFLRGRVELHDALVRCGDNLAIGANGKPVRFAAELLQSPDTPRALEAIRQKLQPDVVLLDLPPMLGSDDVLSALPSADAVILVVAAGTNTLREVDICERTLSERSNMLGVVLNKCRFVPEQYGY